MTITDSDDHHEGVRVLPYRYSYFQWEFDDPARGRSECHINYITTVSVNPWPSVVEETSWGKIKAMYR